MSKAAYVTLLAVLLSPAAGCESGSPVDASIPDGGPDVPVLDPRDGGPRDGGGRDTADDSPLDDAAPDAGDFDTGAGDFDAGDFDAGDFDADLFDAGAGDFDADLFDGGEPDTGIPDVGTYDVGMVDGGPLDATILVDAGGMPDVGMPDVGMPDAGMPDAGMPDGGPSVVVLANGDDLPTCGEYGGSIWPVLPGEAGHYAGTRLTPPSYPFIVDRVAYDLYGIFGRQCDQSFAHEVRVFVSRASAPPARPSASSPVITIAVPAGSPDDHSVELDLSEPLRLEAGDYLYVAVQMAGNTTSSLCIGVCQTFAPVEGVDFWSNAQSEPYAWGDMVVDYGFSSNYTIRAYGHPR